MWIFTGMVIWGTVLYVGTKILHLRELWSFWEINFDERYVTWGLMAI